MKGIKSVFTKMQRINTVIISLALSAMVGMVSLQTFYRLAIFGSLSWSGELSRYLSVILIVLGVNLAIINHLFVRIEIIDNYLKGAAVVMMNLIHKFIIIYVSIVFVYSNFKPVLIRAYQASPTVRTPMNPLYDVIFTGFAVNVFANLIDLYRIYVRIPEKEVE